LHIFREYSFLDHDWNNLELTVESSHSVCNIKRYSDYRQLTKNCIVNAKQQIGDFDLFRNFVEMADIDDSIKNSCIEMIDDPEKYISLQRIGQLRASPT
jgi:hypothetical protein